MSSSSAGGRDLFDLTGRIVIVTGGSRGLGREMSIAFAARGASVVTSSTTPFRYGPCPGGPPTGGVSNQGEDRRTATPAVARRAATAPSRLARLRPRFDPRAT